MWDPNSANNHSAQHSRQSEGLRHTSGSYCRGPALRQSFSACLLQVQTPHSYHKHKPEPGPSWV